MQIFGRLDAFFETGTEGVVWSVADQRLPGYDGLWPLQFGDHLDVLDANGETLWQGIFKLEYDNRRDPTHNQQEVGGYWVHGLQDGADPEAWAKLFFDRERAILTPLAPIEERIPPHPFWGPSATLADRLRALPEERQRELHRIALYSWLYFFFGDGNPQGLAITEWDFTLEETMRLIGATPEQVDEWRQTRTLTASSCVLPFSFESLLQIALLYGVYGGLDWNRPTKEARIAWLNDGLPSPKLLLLSGIPGIALVRDMVAISVG